MTSPHRQTVVRRAFSALVRPQTPRALPERPYRIELPRDIPPSIPR
jgi:hypothetical protein